MRVGGTLDEGVEVVRGTGARGHQPMYWRGVTGLRL